MGNIEVKINEKGSCQIFNYLVKSNTRIITNWEWGNNYK